MNDITAPASRVIEIDRIPPLNVIGDAIRPLYTGDDTGGTHEVFVLDGAKESGPPPHKHPWSEGYILIEGEVAVLIGDTWATLTSGQAAHVPPDTYHAYKILSERAKFVVTTGVGASRFFHQMNTEVHELPRDIPIMVQVATANGLELPPEVAASLMGN